jgi:hypothetical protein
MAKTWKKPPDHTLPLDAPISPPIPQVGDKVIPARSDLIWTVTHVSADGSKVNLNLPGIYLFRVRSDTLKFVDRTPRTSNPAAKDEHKLNATDILQRIGTLQRDNLQRLDDDIAILTKYMKTEGAPKAAIDALNTWSNEVHANWQAAAERIDKLLDV